MDAVNLLIVFILIVLALRYKLSVGITLFGAGAVTLMLYQVDPLTALLGYRDLLTSHRFIAVTAVIVLITTLGQLLKELKSLDRLTAHVRALPGGRKTAVAILPLLVGLMPMPGGSLLSAPMVGDVLSRPRYRREFRTAANYWFRHLVEFSWPIYPGLVLTEAITGMPVGTVSLLQLPLAVLMAIFGLLWFTRRIDNDDTGPVRVRWAVKGIVATIWPIPLAIAIYGLLKLELALSVLIAVLALIFWARPDRAILIRSLKKGFSYKLVFLVFGTLSLQTALELSGAIAAIPRLTANLDVPTELVIFLVCFTAGILTGMVAAFVAICYTLLAGFLYSGGLQPDYIFLAYLFGYLGMFLSPTHLCLILTNEFFQSNLLQVYRVLAVPVILLALSGYLVYLTAWPALFLP